MATTSPAKRISPSIPATSSVSVQQNEKSESKSIYGSVSTSDIAVNLRAILAEHDDGQRIVLGPEEISFVEETEDIDRVKHLGVYKIEIRLNGSSEAVRRSIKVNAQE